MCRKSDIWSVVNIPGSNEVFDIETYSENQQQLWSIPSSDLPSIEAQVSPILRLDKHYPVDDWLHLSVFLFVLAIVTSGSRNMNFEHHCFLDKSRGLVHFCDLLIFFMHGNHGIELSLGNISPAHASFWGEYFQNFISPPIMNTISIKATWVKDPIWFMISSFIHHHSNFSYSNKKFTDPTTDSHWNC